MRSDDVCIAGTTSDAKRANGEHSFRMDDERSFNPSVTWVPWVTLATQHRIQQFIRRLNVGTAGTCIVQLGVATKWIALTGQLERKGKAVQRLSFVVGCTFITFEHHLQDCQMPEDVTWRGRTNPKTCHISSSSQAF
jgi:hypothetical protein